MSATSLSEIIPVLQVAMGPVILISGIGLLLLTMTNRLSRAIDRARALVRESREKPAPDHTTTLAQVAVLYRQARLIRLSIALAGLSALLAAVLIIVLFLAALLGWNNGFLVSVVFIMCLGSLVASLLVFTYDIHLALRALRLELQQVNLAPD